MKTKLSIILVVLCFIGLPSVYGAEKKPSAIEGMVVRLDGTTPIEGVTLTFEKDSDVKLTAKTDKEGKFKLAPIPPGTYRVTVTKEGFKTFSETLEIPENVLKTYKVKLPTIEEARTVRGGEKWKQAMQAYQSGQFETAEQLYKEIVVQDPTYAEAFFNLGVIQARLKKCDEAVKNLEQAEHLKFQPQGKMKLVFDIAMGTCYEALKQFEKAARYYDELSQVFPEQYLIRLANMYIEMKQVDKAIETLEKFLKVAPNAPEAKQVKKKIEELKKIK